MKREFWILVIILLSTSCANTTDVMVPIPEGFFVLGSDQGNPDESPAKNIYLTEFFIDADEVTVQEYEKCINAGICNYPNEGQDYTWQAEQSNNKPINAKQSNNKPINGVSWFDALSYCQFVEKRLPTEAEWEKAASWSETEKRKYKFSIGKMDYINCNDTNFRGIDGSCPNAIVEISAYPAEINGTLQMGGNVWEWVQDWYNPNEYEQIIVLTRNPAGPKDGLLKVNRGGGFLSNESQLRTTFRGANSPSFRSPTLGFRCAKDSK